MAVKVKEDFENDSIPDIQVGNINPIDTQEFMRAIKLINIDKATSVDCTTDFIVREILTLE